MNADIPKDDAEADALRAYIPLETLTALHVVCREEIAESEKRRRDLDDNSAEITAIKERMRKDRMRLKQLDKARQAHFARPLFPRTDAARDAAWIAAAQARREAVDRGEAPRFESLEQCKARQQEGRVYTP